MAEARDAVWAVFSGGAPEGGGTDLRSVCHTRTGHIRQAITAHREGQWRQASLTHVATRSVRVACMLLNFLQTLPRRRASQTWNFETGEHSHETRHHDSNTRRPSMRDER